MHLESFIGQIQHLFDTGIALFNLDLLKLITAYPHLSYGIVFLGTFIEGETFIIVAGYYAHRGLFLLPFLILWAALGSFAGDQLWFYLGRRYGHPLLDRHPRWKPRVSAALALAEKYSTGFILTFRFIYGVRNVSSFALGMSELAWVRFLVLNFIAAMLWASTFAGAGYLFGTASNAFLGDMAQNIGLSMLALFAITVAILVRRQHRKMPAPPSRANTATASTETAAAASGMPARQPGEAEASAITDARAAPLEDERPRRNSR